ncbi:CHAT domain-containing protein [Leucothrix sargassi]|nr:CHAT domain-containing protein [Leucothrix sargassi]
MSGRVILIVESNPKNTLRLSALSEEKRAIRNALRTAGAEDLFTIKTEHAATISDLGDALVRYEPEIVHFMGHGEGEQGLCFHGDDGKKQLLPNHVIDSIFEKTNHTVKLVFLNACYSTVQANIIAKHIDHVIGMSDKIPDQTALGFSKEFYRYIGLKKSVEDAFDWAMTMIEGLNLKDHFVPVLGGKFKPFDFFTDIPHQPIPEKERVDTLVPSSPLLVIPSDASHKIMADKNYLEISTDIESYWGIVNPRRVSSVTELKRWLGMDQHNLVYIYAKANDGEITLDKDLKSGQSLDLNDLAHWFEQEGLRPLLILAIVGRFEESKIPRKLVEQTRFIWCLQSMDSESGLEGQGKAIKHLVEQSTLSDDTSLEAIISRLNEKKRLIKSYTLSSSSNLTLKVDAQSQRDQQQFRAAFFRLVLGRRSLKSEIGMGVNAHLGRQDILAYAVTGSKLSCAFEVPQQVDYHLATSAMGVTVINYPLHTTVDFAVCQDEWELEGSINDVIEQSLKLGSSDLSGLIKKKAEQYGIDINSGAIVFHWNVNVEKGVDESSLKKWLTVWHDLIHDQFGDLLIPQATLVHALCLQVHEDDKVSSLHDTTQNFFRRTIRKSDSQVVPLLIDGLLTKLKETEIEDFFDDPTNQRWADYFRFKDYGIDSIDISEWVCQKTNGEFENVVRELWKAQQTSYAEYKQG